MEGATWLIHRYVMHGFLWYLHEDHHKKYPGFFEKNDWFFFIFAIPSWLCIMLGIQHEQYWIACIGAGLALYGLAYFLVHDVIIHQRFKWFTHSSEAVCKSDSLGTQNASQASGKRTWRKFWIFIRGKEVLGKSKA